MSGEAELCEDGICMLPISTAPQPRDKSAMLAAPKTDLPPGKSPFQARKEG